MMKKSIEKKCNVTSSNIYDNTSGIDFSTVYADYDYSPLTI